MKVAVYYSNDDIRIEEREIPKIGKGEALVKIIACGICGSDFMEWYRIKKAPLVLGHEVTGDIVKLGEGVKKFKTGDRVFVTHHVACGSCRYCRHGNETVCELLRKTNFYPGGFSQYLRVPEINVEKGMLRLPDSVSYEEGTFIEPLACVIRGQRKADMRKGKKVFVIGSGISGILHIQLAKLKGAEQIFACDIHENRLKAAEKFGADYVFDAEEDEEIKADVVIVCTTAIKAMKKALNSVDRGGTVLFFAPAEAGLKLGIEVSRIWKDCITLIASYGAAMRDLKEALELIKRREINVKDMITHELGIMQTAEGFKLASEAKNCLKVIIKPNS